MGRAVDNLKEMLGIGQQPDPLLYLSARARDAHDDAREAQKLASATERAAVNIIARYGTEAVRDFYQELDLIKKHEF